MSTRICAVLAAIAVSGCSLFSSTAPPEDGGRAVAVAKPPAVQFPDAPTPQPMLVDTTKSYADRLSQAISQWPEPKTPPPDVLWLGQPQPQPPTPAQATPTPAALQSQSATAVPPAPQTPPAPQPLAAPQPPAQTVEPIAQPQTPSAQVSANVSQPPAIAQPMATEIAVAEAVPADAPTLVGRLAACIDNDEQGAMAKAVRLVSLRMVEPEVVPDPQAVAGLDEAQRQSILLYQQLMGRLAERLQSGERFSRELVLKQADLLPLTQPLRIKTLQLCRRVQGFGSYEPLPTSSLLAGSDHPMILYLELEDFRSVALDVDRYEVKLAQEVALYSEADGLAVWRQPRAEIVDQSRNARRDFFVVQQIQLPARLTVGKYLLKVRVTDLHAHTIDEETCPLQIVADPALVTVQK